MSDKTDNPSSLISLLDRFAEAYNVHDVEAIMACMSNDCVFVSFFGSDICGQAFYGRAEVEQRVRAGLAEFPDSHWDIAGHFVCGDRGVSEWTFRGSKRGTGEKAERQGVDVFTFRDGKILVKNTFQKWRIPN